MKKRVLAVTMAALMAASLTACGGASNVIFIYVFSALTLPYYELNLECLKIENNSFAQSSSIL